MWLFIALAAYGAVVCPLTINYASDWFLPAMLLPLVLCFALCMLENDWKTNLLIIFFGIPMALACTI